MSEDSLVTALIDELERAARWSAACRAPARSAQGDEIGHELPEPEAA